MWKTDYSKALQIFEDTVMRVARLGRKIVPASLRPKVGKAYHTVRLGVRAAWLGLQKETTERVMLSNPVGRRLHYRLAGAFSREHAAVAAGRMRYRSDLQQARSASFLLRRNTHRIEKGLIMPNRRAVFALEFIEETVAEFEAVVTGFRAQPSDAILSSELQWARDVLGQYFEVTDPDHPKLAALKPRFVAAAALLDGRGRAAPRVAGETAFAPFARDLSADTVPIEALKSLAIRRRSVRNYRADPVPRDVIDAAVEVAGQSPSACNRQAFSFYIFDDPEMARKVAAVPAGTRSFVKGIPHVAVLVGHLRAYPRERDRHAIYVDASLATMGFIYGLEAQGVASCAINWADEEPAESRIAQMLSLAPDDRVIVMVSFGWPAEGALVPYSAKRDLGDIRRYNPGH
jgi:nitroreductase